MKFYIRNIRNLSIPPRDKPYYKIFHDNDQKGFAIRVTDKGVKTFIIDKKIKNKLLRVTLGRVGDLTLQDARTKYTAILRDYLLGIVPIKKEKAKEQRSGITLQRVLDDYITTRILKPNTQNEYKLVVNDKFKQWLHKPMVSITKDLVVKHYAKIGKDSQSAATKAFKILSALFNFAIVNYEDSEGGSIITENPVIRLSQTRAWFPKKRRQTKIDIQDLPKWFKAVNKLYNDTANSIAESTKYYLLVLLFTGLRREEAMPIIWVEFRSNNKEIAKHQRTLDLNKKFIHIPDPKNNQEHWIPLPEYLCNRLTEYKEKTQCKYVFPNANKTNHIIEPRKIMAKVTKISEVPFTLHDIRRTFATIAESLDISAYALKKLLNHKISNSDITASYIVNDVERLREPIERIANYILDVIKKDKNKKSAS